LDNLPVPVSDQGILVQMHLEFDPMLFEKAEPGFADQFTLPHQTLDVESAEDIHAEEIHKDFDDRFLLSGVGVTGFR
jgi:hypothetical protein